MQQIKQTVMERGIKSEAARTINQARVLIYQLQQQGLAVAPDKVQRSPTWKYLGWQISDSIIRPQKLTICNKIATLNDIQKLMGDLQ